VRHSFATAQAKRKSKAHLCAVGASINWGFVSMAGKDSCSLRHLQVQPLTGHVGPEGGQPLLACVTKAPVHVLGHNGKVDNGTARYTNLQGPKVAVLCILVT